MNKYSKVSLDRLETCHPKLQEIFKEVLEVFDHTVICGYRDKDTQNSLYLEGKSKLKFPESKHNTYPSLAIDVAPYDKLNNTIQWQDREWFHYFAGYVLAVARSKGVILRWGGDWQSKKTPNKYYYRKPFDDLPHFEILEIL